MPHVTRSEDTSYLFIFNEDDGVIWWKFHFSDDPDIQEGDGAWCPVFVREVRAWRV